jgi:rhamnulokinase
VTSAAGLRLAAVDLGAESGRVVLGTFDGAQLRTEEAHRFPNVPVHLGGTLYWDFLRIFGDVITGIGRAGDLASIGVDAWGGGLRVARPRTVAGEPRPLPGPPH